MRDIYSKGVLMDILSITSEAAKVALEIIIKSKFL